jgi:hypothetical protein
MPYLYILCRLHWKWTSGFILPLVAYLVFLVVWAEAIPGLLRSPIAAHQASAVGSLRTINTAEFTYSSTYPRGFSPTLPALGPPPGNAETTASAAGLLDDVLAGGRKNGYTFAYLPGPKDSAGRITSYTVVARPLDGSCGTNSYFTDKSGVIRMTEENRPATAKDPPLSY